VISRLFDLLVIGSGPGGQKAALQGAKAGKKVAIIEGNDALGGGCTHSGTLPSKAFRESVYRYALGSKGILGRETSPHSRAKARRPKKVELPEMAKLLERKCRVVEGEAEIVREKLKRNGIEIFEGRAKLLSNTEVEVTSARGRELLAADFIFIATGARPVPPEHLKVDGRRVFDSDSILGLPTFPKSLAVLGAGIIGCEYASIFAAGGTQVTLIDRRQEVLTAVDREIVAHLTEWFQHLGMEILLGAEAVSIEGTEAPLGEAPVRLQLSSGRTLEVDAVLIAQGRYGNTEGLGLEAVGISLGERGLIPVDETFRTSIPTIYAVGDVIGPPSLAATAMEQGRLACCHALGLRDAGACALPPVVPYGIYTIPEISMIGRTEEDLVLSKADFVVGRALYRELARGQIIGDRWGLLKLLVDRKTLKILGVHIIGDSAANLIHIGQAVMSLGGTVHYFVDQVFNYPTLAEAYKTAAFHVLNQPSVSGK
jgi:NAD(P) transhydrogenase